MWTIGRFARLMGMEAKTLRYYDRVGLVNPAGRTRAGYRLYDQRAVPRLLFLRRAKACGVPLCDIGRILGAWYGDVPPCRHTLELVTRILSDAEARISQLETLRRDLLRLRRQAGRRAETQRQPSDCRCNEIARAFRKRQ